MSFIALVNCSLSVHWIRPGRSENFLLFSAAKITTTSAAFCCCRQKLRFGDVLLPLLMMMNIVPRKGNFDRLAPENFFFHFAEVVWKIHEVFLLLNIQYRHRPRSRRKQIFLIKIPSSLWLQNNGKCHKLDFNEHFLLLAFFFCNIIEIFFWWDKFSAVFCN